MLTLLVRFTAFGVSIFLAVLAGMFLSSEESGFPWNTDYTTRFEFSQSPLTKDQAIAGLNGLSNESGLRLAKVVADPEHFLTSQSLYVFGDAAPEHAHDLEWFRPGMTGQLRRADSLGDGALGGTFVYSGSEDARARLSAWLATNGVRSSPLQKTVPAVLSNALISTGAWLPFLTSLVLLISLTVSWYVLRARSRTIKVLNGARSRSILLDDFLSLLVVSAPPFLAGFALALAYVAVTGKGAFAIEFAETTMAFFLFAYAVITLSALVVSAATWPSVAAIAARTPPERHFRLVGETLKVATLLLVAISLPGAGTAIAVATQLSDQGARWTTLSGLVSVRIATTTPDEFDAHVADLDSLITAADERHVLAFSYSVDTRNYPELAASGFDGLVMVNPGYLAEVAPFLSFTGTQADPLGTAGRHIPHDQLAPGLLDTLTSSFELWNRNGDNLDDFEKSFATYEYVGARSFPALTPVPGEMKNLNHPLVAVVDSPSTTFTPDFLASTVSSGNMLFSDSQWLRNYLAIDPLGEAVLSVDRVSDNGIYNSQQQNQTASVRILSYALVVLALVAGIAVSAWIFALDRGRRLFAQRTSGWRWLRIISARISWEAAISAVVSVAIVLSMQGSADPGAWWVLAAIPLYISISMILHLVAVRKVFAHRVARSE
jgi:hypothetical protein